MPVSPTLMQAILAMDSYNQGYDSGLEHGETQIGSATVSKKLSDFNMETEAQAAGFYAITYNWGDKTVISYRGTDGANDIWQGWTTGAGFNGSSQAQLAIDFFETVTPHTVAGGDVNDPNTLLVGHPLGGGTISMHRELAA